jgi:radical SAM superfamily enzyme YgiQ (UPF0313 family)
MSKIVLINFVSGTYGHRMVSAVLKKSGFDVYNIYMGGTILQDGGKVSEKELQSLDGLLDDIKPDMLGISVLTMFEHLNSEILTGRIKKKYGIPIMWGGAYPSLMPEFCMERSGADYVCVGESEQTVVELCRNVTAGKPAAGVAGVMTRESRTYWPPTAAYELDTLPFQDVSNEGACSILSDGAIKEGDPMLNGLYIHGDKVYTTRTSRGCPFKCTYCCINAQKKLYEKGKYLRQRSVDNVMEELRRYMEMMPECRSVMFWDEIFPFNTAWVEEFAGKYKKNFGLPFTVYFHPATTRKANVDLLVEAGLCRVMVGVQSASETTRRDVFQRPETNEQIYAAHEGFSSHGELRIAYDFLIDHPWESPTELEDLLDFVLKLKRPFELNMHSLILFPTTELAKRAVKEGRIKEEEIIVSIISDQTSSTHRYHWIRGVPKQVEMKRAYYLFLIMSAMNPKIPIELIRFLGNSSLLKKHPEIITDNVIIDMRDERAFAGFVQAMIDKHGFIKKLFGGIPFLDKSVKGIPESRKSLLGYFYGYLAYRFVRKLPAVMVSELSK